MNAPATTQDNTPAAKGMTIKELVIAQFKAEEPALLAMAAKYKDVAFDCPTPKGMVAAKAARHELREHGRFKVQRAVDQTKAEANDLKRVIDEESGRLIAITKPVEDEIDKQIKAEELRQAADKAERERLAAERKALHEGKIATIRGCADRAKGLPSERITNGIAQVEALAFGEDCAEFLPQYEAAKAETLTAMRDLLAQVQQRERDEAQRLENERVAAELEQQRQALAAQAAELARKKREQDEAEQRRLEAITHAAIFTFPDPEPVAAPVPPPAAEAIRTPQPAGEPPVPTPPSPAPAPTSLVAQNNAARASIAKASQVVRATPAAEVAWINTATLSYRLNWPMSAAICEDLGYPGTKRQGPGMWWDAAKVEAIGRAAMTRIRVAIEAMAVPV